MPWTTSARSSDSDHKRQRYAKTAWLPPKPRCFFKVPKDFKDPKVFNPISLYNSNNPSGNTSFIVLRSKSIAAMNSSAAGTRCRLPPISISNRGFASLS